MKLIEQWCFIALYQGPLHMCLKIYPRAHRVVDLPSTQKRSHLQQQLESDSGWRQTRAHRAPCNSSRPQHWKRLLVCSRVKISTQTNIRWKDLAPKGQQRCKLQPKKYVKAGDPKDVKPSYVLVTKNLTLGYTADQISTYPMLNNRPPVCVPIISLQTTSLPWFYRDRDSAGCKLWAGGGKKNLHDRLGKKKQEQIVWGITAG